MKKKLKDKRTSILLTPVVQQQLADLKEITGAITTTQVVYQAINYYHRIRNK